VKHKPNPFGGVYCSECKSTRSGVAETHRLYGQILRIRKCRACGKRFETREETTK
jgi:transcriptional regulator NrdR family protein